MVLKLYGSPVASCTLRVAVVLYEKKIPFELYPIDLQKGEHKVPTYLEKQPFGQVPLLDDDGFVVFESRAICRYLEAKYPNQGPKLVPASSDLKATALFEQAASIETANFDSFAGKVAVEGYIKPQFFNLPKNQVVYDEAAKTLSAKLDAYEKILSRQKYLAGDELTLADLYHLPFGTNVAAAGCDLLTSKGPNVTRWWKDISSRESWTAVKKGIPAGAIEFD
ncbi:hypothetical protein D9758_010192 [Tetrapyrgos nigripes]|uniref:glutathione transferase n=1 Tax=Tetrapyrgos nigripes TaxID=182062 RepID=A0A8H5CXK3_9AGAR|nr:hypothetical protein D9758_010192 [Tetrapyrgos nigripes]